MKTINTYLADYFNPEFHSIIFDAKFCGINHSYTCKPHTKYAANIAGIGMVDISYIMENMRDQWCRLQLIESTQIPNPRTDQFVFEDYSVAGIPKLTRAKLMVLDGDEILELYDVDDHTCRNVSFCDADKAIKRKHWKNVIIIKDGIKPDLYVDHFEFTASGGRHMCKPNEIKNGIMWLLLSPVGNEGWLDSATAVHAEQRLKQKQWTDIKIIHPTQSEVEAAKCIIERARNSQAEYGICYGEL
jgi:hypothetical protein